MLKGTIAQRTEAAIVVLNLVLSVVDELQYGRLIKVETARPLMLVLAHTAKMGPAETLLALDLMDALTSNGKRWPARTDAWKARMKKMKART